MSGAKNQDLINKLNKMSKEKELLKAEDPSKKAPNLSSNHFLNIDEINEDELVENKNDDENAEMKPNEILEMLLFNKNQLENEISEVN